MKKYHFHVVNKDGVRPLTNMRNTMNKKFTEDERQMLDRMIDYFVRAEEREVTLLSGKLANPKALAKSKDMLSLIKSIKNKIQGTLY